MEKKFDCCFCLGKDWFRYRVGAIIVSDGYALFTYGEKCGYYYTVGGGVHIGERSEEAILREVSEETGDEFAIERPLCLVENFFDGDGALEGLDCHTLELYYLMKPKAKKEYNKTSITTGGDKEKMCWIPIDKIDEYDIRPVITKKLLKEMPQEFTVIVNDNRGYDYIISYEKGIKQEEIDFPKRFASYEEKEYGILFYMADNKDSYDGNHACIYPDRITDLGAVLDDITKFYNKLGIKASIYHPFEKDYFKNNLDTLKAHGYTYTAEDDHRVMLLTAENNIVTPERLDIRVLNKWDERVATDVLIPSGEPWEIEVTKKRTEQDGTYLFVGYLDGKAVVYSDIHKSEHGNTRFDYIVTAKEHRGKGYASELLSFMVEYCKENKFPMCWQWAGPSEHICYKAGFREAFTIEAGFASKT